MTMVAAGLLANVMVVLHFAFIVFVVLGGFLVWRWRWVAWLHVPAALWGAAIEFVGGVCPLTPLENQWRMQAGEAGYSNSFIEQYLASLIYPAGLTPSVQIYLGAAVLLINMAIYGVLLYRAR
jgi:hypothetical protein